MMSCRLRPYLAPRRRTSSSPPAPPPTTTIWVFRSAMPASVSPGPIGIESGVLLDDAGHRCEIGVLAVGGEDAFEQRFEPLAGRQRHLHRGRLLEREPGVLQAQLGGEPEV